MEANAQELMTELRLDHRNMAAVLRLLDELVELMEAGKDPDFELFDEIMRYMTVYPDAVHHPNEDVVYGKLRRERPDLAEDLEHVPDDHSDIAHLGSLLRNEVEAINAGAAVRRDKMIEDTATYVRRLRDHKLVNRVWVPGSRRDHHEAAPDIFGQAYANHAAKQAKNLALAHRYQDQLDAADAVALADVPDKQTLRAQLLGVLQGPARGLATVLDALPSGVARVLQARVDAAGPAEEAPAA